VWLLLESGRFARLGPSVLAGVAVAAGFHVKGTFVLVVAGLVLVLLLRGGWRNRTGFLAFAGVALLLVLPWHLAHLGDLLSQTEGATDGRALVWYGSETYPSRWSPANFTWYGWAAVNTQLYLPLTLFVVGGGGYAAWRLARGRERDTYLPELLAGGIVAYAGISLINLDDPRYTLPALVYAAVLGTWWVTRLPRPAMLATAAVLGAILVANTVIHDAGIGDPVRIDLPGAKDDPIARGSLTLVSGAGYVEGAPRRDGIRPDLQALLERARRDGARRAVFDVTTMGPSAGFNPGQLRVIGRLAGLRITPLETPALPAPEPGDVIVTRLPVRDAGLPPCVPSGAGYGIYLLSAPGGAPSCPAR
jgi:4-amino-4-deoxy-L-arabinose transferase-like glycosyltransferase